MKTITRIGSRPTDAPDGWPIHNAPRPLYGQKTWQGDFVHGVFYAAIDPADEYSPGFLTANERNDAYELVYLSKEEAISRAFEWYQQNLPHVAKKINLDDIDHIGMMLRGWLGQVNK